MFSSILSAIFVADSTKRIKHCTDHPRIALQQKDSNPWLTNDATAIGLLRLLVKHLGLCRKIIRALYQVVQLHPTFQDTVNGFVQNLSGFVQIILDFSNTYVKKTLF